MSYLLDLRDDLVVAGCKIGVPKMRRRWHD